MFVQWKWRQKRIRHWRYEGLYSTQVSAVLVRSVRTDAGPRHERICYLGAISTISKDKVSTSKPSFARSWRRQWFWESAELNLDKAGIGESDRERIVAALKAVVPKPEPAPPREPYDIEAERAKLGIVVRQPDSSRTDRRNRY
jgi:hypothetical protein